MRAIAIFWSLVARIPFAKLPLWLGVACGGLVSMAYGQPQRLEATALFSEVAAREEWRWQSRFQPEPPDENLTARGVMAYALTLAEADQLADRLPRLLELLTRMQDRDPDSPDYGNFWWYWRDGTVTDRNSVEFVMQTATRFWNRHGERLDAERASVFREILAYGARGSLRHRVPVWYTNIAILNASNLIVLGEILDLPEVAQSGYGRLEDICLWTWQYGITEHVSPTYYAVNLDGLRWIASQARREEGRRQAEALLELLALDIGANWWPPAERLGGAHSRSYNYLRGIGGLDERLALAGWLDLQVRPGIHHADALSGDWQLPSAARELADRLPRRVRQRWGEGATESRSALFLPDITLSASGAHYGTQDVPLAVDLPGDRTTVRCYFLGDGRGDPYGTRRFSVGRAGHGKALHLPHFWAATQRGPDVLALAAYRREDLEHTERTGLTSHFVFRRNHQGMWVGEQPVDFQTAVAQEPTRVEVDPDEPVVIRYGSAAVGLRVVGAQQRDGRPAPIALVDDANPHGALRLSVVHETPDPQETPARNGQPDAMEPESAVAALWVRVGSGLQDQAAFDAWRADFAAAESQADFRYEARDGHSEPPEPHFQLQVAGAEGPLSLDIRGIARGAAQVRLEPPPAEAILEIDGQPVGRTLLDDLSPIRDYSERAKRAPIFAMQPGQPLLLEAETGLYTGGMEIGRDPDASGGAYVSSCPERYQAERVGSVRWTLYLPQPGRYWLWGRILAPDPESDSFYVQVLGPEGALLARTAWHTGQHPDWKWRRFESHPGRQPIPLDLPAGHVELLLFVRETGTKIDQWKLTPDPELQPIGPMAPRFEALDTHRTSLPGMDRTSEREPHPVPAILAEPGRPEYHIEKGERSAEQFGSLPPSRPCPAGVDMRH